MLNTAVCLPKQHRDKILFKYTITMYYTLLVSLEVMYLFWPTTEAASLNYNIVIHTYIDNMTLSILSVTVCLLRQLVYMSAKQSSTW